MLAAFTTYDDLTCYASSVTFFQPTHFFFKLNKLKIYLIRFGNQPEVVKPRFLSGLAEWFFFFLPSTIEVIAEVGLCAHAEKPLVCWS